MDRNSLTMQRDLIFLKNQTHNSSKLPAGFPPSRSLQTILCYNKVMLKNIAGYFALELWNLINRICQEMHKALVEMIFWKL